MQTYLRSRPQAPLDTSMRELNRFNFLFLPLFNVGLEVLLFINSFFLCTKDTNWQVLKCMLAMCYERRISPFVKVFNSANRVYTAVIQAIGVAGTQETGPIFAQLLIWLFRVGCAAYAFRFLRWLVRNLR